MTIKKLLEKRAKAVADARALLEKAESEKRDLTDDETKAYDAAMVDVDKFKQSADGLQKLETAEKELTESRGRQTNLETKNKQSESETRTFELNKSVLGDVRSILLSGEKATKEYGDAFVRYLLTGEKRALQKDSDTTGGFLSAPMQFMAELIKAVDNQVFMRQIARVLPPVTTADSLGVPSLDNDPADPIWTSELGTGDEDSTMSFGKRELKPHPLAKRIKVSKKLLRSSSIGVEPLVRDRLAYKVAVVMENNFLNGNGANQPLGVMTASNNGISTGRDVSTGNTTTAIKFDGLYEAKYTLKPQYVPRSTWLFHRDGVKQIAKLKDGEGRYLWQPSVVVGVPDMILGIPVRQSEYMPNTFETTEYVGILGDFSKYWIVDALTTEIQALLELYAATNQNGYIIRAESDGMPVLEEAFVRVKLA